MKKLLMSLTLLAMAVSCSDGGGGNGNGSPSGLNHNQLAESFVNNLNVDPEFSVTLVKGSTLQTNFIVIYDPGTDSYDALNIDLYDPAANDAAGYYFEHSARGFFDLDVIPGFYETYTDYEFIGYDEYGDSVYGYVEKERYNPTLKKLMLQ